MSRHPTDSDTGSASSDVPGAPQSPSDDESFFRELIEHHPGGLVTIDATGNIVYANPAFANLLGYEPATMLEQPIETVLVGPEGDAPRVLDEGPPATKRPNGDDSVDADPEADGSSDSADSKTRGTLGSSGTLGDLDGADEHPVIGHHADGTTRALSLVVLGHDATTTTGVVRERNVEEGPERAGDERTGGERTEGEGTESERTEDEGTDGDRSSPADGGRDRNLRAYEAIVESMADGVVVFGPGGNIRIVNETFARPLGYAPDDLLGERVATLAADGVVPASAFDDWTANLEAVIEDHTDERRFETRLETVSGERRFEVVLTRLPTGEPDVVAVVRDVTVQYERDRRLGALHEATRELMLTNSTAAVAEAVVDAAQTILDIPIAAVRRHTAADRLELVAWTEQTEHRLGLDRTYTVGEGLVGRAFETGEIAVHDDLNEVDDGHERSGIESAAYLPIGEHGTLSLGAIERAGFDKTDIQLATLLATNAAVAIERADRRHTLESLYDTTRRLMQAESPSDVARLAVETARDALDLPLTGVWLYDEESEALEPVAYPPEAETIVEDVPSYAPGNSVSWRAFATGEVQIHDDLATVADTYTESPAIHSEIVVPLGRHGVLNVGSTSVEAFDDEDVYFARALAANTEAALDRAARERELATQRDELATLARVNAVIQAIIQELTGAATREEIERIVCERFAESDRYQFAWIGTHDTAAERIVPRTTTDHAAAYLDTIEVPTDDDAALGPSHRAAQTGEIAVSQDVRTDPDFAPWREQAREFGYRSTAAVPLRHQQVTYGQLAVYAVEPDAFGERERDALSVLGETVGFALNAARNIQLLRGNSVTELDLRAPKTATLLGVLATRLDARVRLDSVVPSGDETLQYLAIEGASATAVEDALANPAALPCAANVHEWRVIDEHDSGCRIELATTDSSIGTLVAAGATVSTAIADDDGVQIVAEAAPDADVRGLVNTIRGVNPAIELRAKRETDRPVRTTDEFRDRIDDELTDRQGTALRAAYAAGYYDWPRESTAEEVAESMGIASPTLHSHLRKAQRTVLDALFEDDSE